MEDIYQHYKGGLYYVFDVVSTHTETGERCVLYYSVDEENPSPLWARPYDMFHGYLEDGRKRFVLVEED